MNKIIKASINKEIPFEYIEKEIIQASEKPVHSIQEIRLFSNKKYKGDLFEDFCYLYLKARYSYVWLLKDVPEDILTKLRLRKQDFGIDIICMDKASRYYAVQCKFRKMRRDKNWIPWKELATFYALASRTGPEAVGYHKHIVMTNVLCVRHISKKTKQDYSICRKTFMNLKSLDLLKMINSKEEDVKEKVKVNIDFVREQRLKYYESCK